MTNEGRVWSLDHQSGCLEYRIKGRGRVVVVPHEIEAKMVGVAIGDMVSWDGGWHRITGIEHGSSCGMGIGLVLAASMDSIDLALNANGDALPRVKWDLRYAIKESGPELAETLAQEAWLAEQLKRVTDGSGTEMPKSRKDPFAVFDGIDPGSCCRVYLHQLGKTEPLARVVGRDENGELWMYFVGSRRLVEVGDAQLVCRVESFEAVPQPPVRGEPGFVSFVLPTMTTRSGEMPGMNNGCRTLYLPQFDEVQPGRPWWWWFERGGMTTGPDRAVYQVVRDGSKNLWVSHPHGSIKVQEFAGWVPIGPVAAVPDGTQAWQKIRDLETLLAGERLARKRDWDSDPGAYHREGEVERLQRELTELRNTISRDRSELERWDQRWTAARLELDKAGVPDWRPYTPEEQAATASADGVTTGAGVMIPMSERVAMLVAQRDKERKAWAEARMALDGAGVPGGQEVDTVSLADRVRMLTAQRDGWMAVCGKKDVTMSALQVERDDLQAKLDEMKEDRGWKEVDRVRAILEKAGVYATTGAPSWRVLSTSEQLWELVADRDDLKAKLDEARTAIEEVVEKVTRAKEAREEQSYGIGCDSGAAIRPGDARAILRRSVPAATDTRDWDALPTARPEQSPANADGTDQQGMNEAGRERDLIDCLVDARNWEGMPLIGQPPEDAASDAVADNTESLRTYLVYADGTGAHWENKQEVHNRLRERVAAKAHEVWARWWRYQHQTTTLVPNTDSYHEGFQNIMRWTRKMGTAYAGLSEEEKGSDRVIADAYLELILGAMGMEP